MATTQKNYTSNNAVLYIGLELSKHKWVIGGSIGLEKVSIKTLESWAIAAFGNVISSFIEQFGLQTDCQVKICFEAGLDGFSVYRALCDLGFEVLMVDSSSIETNRHKRRAKTDKIDVKKLTQLLYRYRHGEKGCLKPVRIPSESQEDLRRIHREYERLQKEQTQHSNRLLGLLASQGIKLSGSEVRRQDFETRLRSKSFKTATGKPIGRHLQGELEREYDRYKLVKQQLLKLMNEAKQAVEEKTNNKVTEYVQQLTKLKGVGFWGAFKLVTEWFGWREFSNRKEVGSAAGMTGVPHASGELAREQGISKAGNKRIRTLMVDLSWCWLRYQGNSRLSQWFHERFSQGKRVRRIGIVALARKLLVTFWRYLSQGVLPSDIELKEAK